jgi:hypothetical protein
VRRTAVLSAARYTRSHAPSKWTASMTGRSRISFSSGKIGLCGYLYLPDGAQGRPVPCVVLCHGFSGTMDRLTVHASRFANAGTAALLFDYRPIQAVAICTESPRTGARLRRRSGSRDAAGERASPRRPRPTRQAESVPGHTLRLLPLAGASRSGAGGTDTLPPGTPRSGCLTPSIVEARLVNVEPQTRTWMGRTTRLMTST